MFFKKKYKYNFLLIYIYLLLSFRNDNIGLSASFQPMFYLFAGLLSTNNAFGVLAACFGIMDIIYFDKTQMSATVLISLFFKVGES